jgi:recombination protein RecT
MTENMIQNATAKTAVAKTGTSLKDYITKMQGEIAKALPSVITPERFTRITLSALSTNPQLQQCTPGSFLGAMMTAAQLGLEPNTPLGQAYLIPFRNKGTLECQFQLGYKGLLDLAYRSGEISVIQAHTVYAKDDFEYELGLEPKLKHKPHMGADKGEPIAFYALFRTKDGGFGFEVMSVEDVRSHAKKYSKAFGSGFSPWQTNFEEMAKKTVFRSIFKWLPVSIEQVMATTGDGAVAKYNANAVDADDALEVEFVAAEDDGTVEAVEEAPVGVDEAVEKMAEQMKV